MDGLLIVDKPSGPTSHDIVAVVRRTLHERRIGHTGTLDPMATGVLPLVIGRATRLSQFLTAHDKHYQAVVRLGTSTDSGDAQGQPIGAAWSGGFPTREAIDQALNEFRGTFLQQPPAFSAKKVGGQRSYRVARARARAAVRGPALAEPPDSALASVLPAPVSVTAHAIQIVDAEGALVTLRLSCSAGFYVRTLATDLGERLGTGGHLAALRRTGSGQLTLAEAVSLDTWLQQDAASQAEALVPLARMLPDMPAVSLSAEGVAWALHGRDLTPASAVDGFPDAPVGSTVTRSAQTHFRLMDPGGELIGIAERLPSSGLLHPAVVLM